MLSSAKLSAVSSGLHLEHLGLKDSYARHSQPVSQRLNLLLMDLSPLSPIQYAAATVLSGSIQTIFHLHCPIPLRTTFSSVQFALALIVIKMNLHARSLIQCADARAHSYQMGIVSHTDHLFSLLLWLAS